MPKLTVKELALEMEELIPVIIFPPVEPYPYGYYDGVGDEMECGFYEADYMLPGSEIFFL